jgi:flagellar motility protein MotE (MotC chaperone)
MSKGIKIGGGLFVLLMLALGTAYGLAKLNVIPVQKMGEHNPALGSALSMAGLYHRKPHIVVKTHAPDPLADDRRALQGQRDALKQQQTDWEAQKQAQVQSTEKAKEAATAALPDPKEMQRLAAIYEEMPVDAVNKIFAKLPDQQVIALLRRMDEKQVGSILAGVTPERAARLTLALSRSPVDTAPGVHTAANTP